MTESIDQEAVREAVAPVGQLYAEHQQLTDLLHDAFGELEALQDELTGWQHQLDEQDASRAEGSLPEGPGDDALRRELEQLEAENAERLQALEDLERDHAVALGELATLREQTSELSQLLTAQREQAEAHRQRWMAELQAVRATIQSGPAPIPPGLPGTAGRLAQPVAASTSDDGESADNPNHNVSRAAQLRQRAKAQRAARHPQ